MIFTIIIYSIWVLAINGAVEPGTLEGLPGTAFTPLTKKIGPIIHVLGSIFVILGMGMASVHFSLGLFNAVGERLPAPRGKINYSSSPKFKDNLSPTWTIGRYRATNWPNLPWIEGIEPKISLGTSIDRRNSAQGDCLSWYLRH